MAFDTEEILDLLIKNISQITEVEAIGLSGNKSPIPKAGEGDLDIFIYCDSIPDSNKREAAIEQIGDLIQNVEINIFEGGHWGVGDFMLVNGIETWLMYFKVQDTLHEIETILSGDYPEKQDNYFYPIGRCAMLKYINILYDKRDFLCSLKKRVYVYPDKLAGILIQYHLGELEDIEDLERAVSRKDVLFYHFAMDLALDHYFQALFALNKEYFPSRKRNLELIGNFNVKPQKLSERLLEVIRLGGSSESIRESYELWSDMVYELKKICKY